MGRISKTARHVNVRKKLLAEKILKGEKVMPFWGSHAQFKPTCQVLAIPYLQKSSWRGFTIWKRARGRIIRPCPLVEGFGGGGGGGGGHKGIE